MPEKNENPIELVMLSMHDFLDHIPVPATQSGLDAATRCLEKAKNADAVGDVVEHYASMTKATENIHNGILKKLQTQLDDIPVPPHLTGIDAALRCLTKAKAANRTLEPLSKPNLARRARSYVITLASFMALLLCTTLGWFLWPSAAPEQFPAFAIRDDAFMGPLGSSIGLCRINWALPPKMVGYIAVIEVAPDGTLKVQPLRNNLCQFVDSRASAGVQLSLSFRAGSQNTVVLVLTDVPAAEQLVSIVNSQVLTSTSNHDTFLRNVSHHLRSSGVVVRANGICPIVR